MDVPPRFWKQIEDSLFVKCLSTHTREGGARRSLPAVPLYPPLVLLACEAPLGWGGAAVRTMHWPLPVLAPRLSALQEAALEGQSVQLFMPGPVNGPKVREGQAWPSASPGIP